MEEEKFKEIVELVKAMDSRQRFDLFHEIEKYEDIIIPYYVSQSNLEEDMENYGNEEALTENEWQEFCKKFEQRSSKLRVALYELQLNILEEVRPDWDKCQEE